MSEGEASSHDLVIVQADEASASAAVAQADSLRRRFDMAAAEAAASRVVSEHPGYAAGHLAFGRVLLATRHLDGALTQFTEAARLAPDWEDAVAWQIAALSRQRRFDEAAALGRTACAERFPDGALVRVAVGRSYLDSSSPLEALPHLAEATQHQPDDMRMVRWHTRALASLLSWAAARELTQAAVARNPASARAHLVHGLLMGDSGQRAEALRSLERAYALDPDDPLVLEWRVTALRALRRPDAAADAAAEAVGRYPLAPRLHVERAWALSLQDREREALACVDRALAIDPGDDWALESRVDFLGYLDRYREAGQAAAEALERRPDCADLYLVAARTEQGHDVAFSHVDRALALDPRNADVLRYRIERLGDARRFGEAEQVAQEAGRLHPYDPRFAACLAYLYERPDERRDDACGRALQDALRIDPENDYALQRQGALFLRTGGSEPARAVFRMFLGAFPDDPGRCLEIAACYADEEQYATAAEYAREALAIDPHNPFALRRRVDYLNYAHRFDDAEEAALHAVAQRPGDAEMPLRLAQLYFDCGRYTSALSVLNRLPAVRHLQVEMDKLSSRTMAKLGDRRTAVRLIRPGSGPDRDLERYIALSDLYEDHAKYRRALKALDPALRDEPDHEVAWRSRIKLLLQLRRLDDARTASADFLKRWPRDAYRCVDISLIYSRQGHHDEAVRYSQLALQIDPAYDTALRNLVYHLVRAGRMAEARQAALRVAGEYPDDPLSHLALSYMEEDSGDYDAGLRHAQQALILAPDLDDALSQRFDLLLALRRYDEARQEADRLTRHGSVRNHNALLDHLASAAERNGQLEIALTCRRRAVELNPQDTEAVVAYAGLLSQLERYREARARLEGIRGNALPTAETVISPVSQIAEKPHDAVKALAGLYQAMGCRAKGRQAARDSWRQLVRDRDWWRTGGPFGLIRRRLTVNDDQVIQRWEAWAENGDLIETLPGLRGPSSEAVRADYDTYILGWARRAIDGEGLVAAMRPAARVSVLAASWAFLYFSFLPGRVALGHLLRAAFALAIVLAGYGVFACCNVIIRSVRLWLWRAGRIMIACAVVLVTAFLVDPPHDLAAHAAASGAASLIRLGISGGLIISAVVMVWIWLITGLATVISDFRVGLFQRRHPRPAILDHLLDIIDNIGPERWRNNLPARSNWVWLLEQTAHRLERDLPRHYGKLDPHTAEWFSQRAAGSARWVRSLKQQVILPGHGSWERLGSSVRQMAAKVADGDFAGLHWTEPVPVTRERKRVTFMLRFLRTIAVMALPALAVVITGLVIPLTGGTYRSATLLSLGWAVLYLLLSIDPTLRDKIDTARGVLETVRGTSKPVSSGLPAAGDERPDGLTREPPGQPRAGDRAERAE